MESNERDQATEPNVIAAKEQDGETVRYGLFEGGRLFRRLDASGDAPERSWDELELDGFGFTANYPEVRAYRDQQSKGRMTTRERRERRAERRRDWAEGREAKADAAHQAAHDATAAIPFGQPILVGHHSESKHRRAVQRGQRQASKAVEHSDMAQRHRQAAETIERQLDQSIYDDDPDAIERLSARIERAGRKASRDEGGKRSVPQTAPRRVEGHERLRTRPGRPVPELGLVQPGRLHQPGQEAPRPT